MSLSITGVLINPYPPFENPRFITAAWYRGDATMMPRSVSISDGRWKKELGWTGSIYSSAILHLRPFPYRPKPHQNHNDDDDHHCLWSTLWSKRLRIDKARRIYFQLFVECTCTFVFFVSPSILFISFFLMYNQLDRRAWSKSVSENSVSENLLSEKSPDTDHALDDRYR